MIEVREIADRLNACALELCREFLPGGQRNGDKWAASNIWDTGKTHSLMVTLSGRHIGKWRDFGGASPGEEEGDMIDLLNIRRYHGKDKVGAIQEAKRRLGIDDPFVPGQKRPARDPEAEAAAAEAARHRALRREAEEQADQASRIKGAKALWHRPGAVAIKGTPAEAYLWNRGLDHRGLANWPGSFRFHPEVWCKDEGVKVPALLCAAFTPAGEHVATHRVFLQNCPQRGWTKIDSPHAKKVLGVIGGAFIPINKGSSGKSMTHMPDGEPVYMAEGPEKCVALRMVKPDARILCGYSLHNMGAIVFPERMGELIIAADAPKSPKELDAFEKVVARQQSRGVTVRSLFPPAPHKDFDEWMVAVLRSAPQTDLRRLG